MEFVWAVWDYERYDTRDSEEPHLVALFDNREAALATRKRLEVREHPAARLGYVYRFEIAEYPVHASEFTENDIARGCADEISPPYTTSVKAYPPPANPDLIVERPVGP